MASSADDAVARGAELLEWLREQENQPGIVAAAIAELNAWLDKAPPGLSMVAAAEVLVRSAPELAEPHLVRMLAERPVGDLHIYSLAFARVDGVATNPGALTAGIVAMLEASPGDRETATHLAVEAVTSLAVLSPASILLEPSVARAIESSTGFEQTRLLDAVAQAIRATTARPSAAFSRALAARWSAVVSTSETDMADLPGVAARLLEIKGRTSLGFDVAMHALAQMEIEYRVLYQLLQRDLDFLPADDQGKLLVRALRLLAARGQIRSFARLLEMRATQNKSVLMHVSAALADSL
jgi:hypothetical protein